MGSHFTPLQYIASYDRVVVRSGYSGTVNEIEEFIRRKRASELEIRFPDKLSRLPCVTFITKMEMCFVWRGNVSAIEEAIRAMMLLEAIHITYSDDECDEWPITNTIATHPSLKKIEIFGRYGGVGVITKRNPRITNYSLGTDVATGYEYGDILVEAAGIMRFCSTNKEPVFRDGDLVRFVRNNSGIRYLGITVSRVSEVVAALGYLDAICGLRIECQSWDETSDLKSTIIDVIARCHPKYLDIYGGGRIYDRTSVWPNHYIICHEDLPKWSFSRSGPICDVVVRTARC